MRSLIISTSIIIVLISIWSIYNNYSDDTITQLTTKIENDIITGIYQENWDETETKCEEVKAQWDKYRKIAIYFYSVSKLDEIDSTISRAFFYVKAKDVSNSAGECACLSTQLKYLYLNETLALRNIL